MRTTLLSVAIASFLLTGTRSTAQCPGCQTDLACQVSPAYPTLCPAAPPAATSGVYYETDLTFWLPATFDDPGTGLTVDFLQMTITSIAGIPFGLAIETSDPLGVYDPQQSEFGCARICGTPLGAGTFPITISILATVEFSGFEVDVPETFPVILTVLPGTGSNFGFTFSPSSGCAPVTSTFGPLITGGGAPVTYDWDFGNGNLFTGDTPPPQTFTQAGDHLVTLTTSIGGYQLDQVELVSVNGNWCGDVEEPDIPLIGCTGSPDLYYVITDGNGDSYTSSTQDDASGATWSGLGVTLSQPPYSIAFFDEDPVSQDDALGTYNLTLGVPGTYPFSIAGGTVGSLIISETVLQIFHDTDIVQVFALPDMTWTYDSLSQTLCLGDTALVSVTWFLDGDTIPNANGLCVQTNDPGSYWATGTNGFGCTGLSDTLVICPVITITSDAGILYTDNGFATYAWTFNGTPISGADGAFIFAQGDGNYAVTITTNDCCTVSAEYTLISTGVSSEATQAAHLIVFPVPNEGRFTVRALGAMEGQAELQVMDVQGRVQATLRPWLVGDTSIEIDLGDVAPGTYLVQLRDASGKMMVRAVAVY
ncbi:MAG: T9SS type A sorting domain-containing protein [Flavobacteriales bacterium]|nr:T9SS type A sorting domain-containing protein [Flavobacteriales bacterium]